MELRLKERVQRGRRGIGAELVATGPHDVLRRTDVRFRGRAAVVGDERRVLHAGVLRRIRIGHAMTDIAGDAVGVGERAQV